MASVRSSGLSPLPSVPGVSTSGCPDPEKTNPGSAEDLKLHMNTQCKILGDSIAQALDKFLPMVDTTKVRKGLDEIMKNLKDFNEIKDLIKEISKDGAKAQVVEDQLQAMVATLVEPLECVKPMQDQILTSIEEEIRALTNMNSNDAMDALNMNQSLILKELKKSSNPEDHWIETLIEALKKVQTAQVDLAEKSELQTSLTNSLLPMLENTENGELKDKIELFTQLEDNHASVQEGREDVRNLIKDVKIILDAKKESDAESTGQRRKKSRGKKRSSSTNIRRSRKSAKVSYTEPENSEEDE